MVTKTRSAPPRTVERVGVATEGAAQAALRRGQAQALTAEEERVLRMRLGASPPRAAPLERTAELTDLEIEVYAAEIEAYMRWKAHRARLGARPAPAPVPSRTKERIIRALRRK